MPSPRPTTLASLTTLAALIAWTTLSACAHAGGPASPPAAPASPPADTAPAASGADSKPDTEPEARPLKAAFLVVDGVYNSELMAPYDILQHTIFHTEPGIEVFTVSPDGKQITTFEGLRLVPHYSFADAPAADILVVPSAEGSMGADLENRALIEWVRRTAEAADFVVSLCDGAFLLAEAGLLDGLAATTFPSDYDAFAIRYPQIDLKINVSFVHDDRFLTSQGGARSYDVAMYLVDLLYGEEVARGVGRGLIIPWPPEPERIRTYVTDPKMKRQSVRQGGLADQS